MSFDRVKAMPIRSRILIAVFAALMLSACGSKPTQPDDAATSAADDAAGGQQSGLSGEGAAGQGRVGDGRDLGTRPGDEQLRRQTVIYFDFDSSEFDSRYDVMLDAHARLLVSSPSTRLRLEGHTDERGTREYNIGLGERRALAVRRALLLRGASKSQLDITSYGEERPAALGATEAAWTRNRRVELVYQ